MHDKTGVAFQVIIVLLALLKTGYFGHYNVRKKAEDVCGHPNGMVSGKIVGGYDVGYYKYPWFVALYKDDTPYCGATLISRKSAVTAAHCYQEYVNNPKGIEREYEIRMGTYNICNTQEPTMKHFQARKVYIHEKYANEDPFYDIALIVFGQEVAFEPACLPIKGYSSSERPKEGIIAGYGVVKFQDTKTSCVMREARVRIYKDKACKKMLKKADPELNNFAMAFCAGYLEGGVDACQGDSGGPLMVLQSGSRFALLGLTSFGYKCAAKGLLGIYTDVSQFLDWIETKTNEPINDNPTEGSEDTDDNDSDSDIDDEDEDNSESDEGDGDYDDSDEDKKKKNKIHNSRSVSKKRKHKKHHSYFHQAEKPVGHSMKSHHHGNKENNPDITRPAIELKKLNKKKHQNN